MVSRILRILLILGALAAIVFVVINRRNYSSVLPHDLFEFKSSEVVEPEIMEADSIIKADTIAVDSLKY